MTKQELKDEILKVLDKYEDIYAAQGIAPFVQIYDNIRDIFSVELECDSTIGTAIRRMDNYIILLKFNAVNGKHFINIKIIPKILEGYKVILAEL